MAWRSTAIRVAINQRTTPQLTVTPPKIPMKSRVFGGTQFGADEGIALADLKIELLFPADDPSRALLEAMAGEG